MFEDGFDGIEKCKKCKYRITWLWMHIWIRPEKVWNSYVQGFLCRFKDYGHCDFLYCHCKNKNNKCQDFKE